MTKKSEVASKPAQTQRGGGIPGPITLLALAAGGFLLYRNGEKWLRTILIYLSRAGWARMIVTKFPPAWRVAGRFVAGESVDEAIDATRQLNARGITVAMDFLGESVSQAEEANAARDQILYLLDRMNEAGVDAYVSVKLSQLGLNIDENLAVNNLRTILTRAREYNRRVRIDMEESTTVDVTLDIYRRLREGEGFNNVGVVIQACLFRSEADVQQLIEEGAWVRMVKGAYKEPPQIAYAKKSDTDANMVKLVKMMLSDHARKKGAHVAVATHDDAIISATQQYVRGHAVASKEFEFQLLYGIRRELQEQLVAQGYQVRVYVPYGTAWYPYFMRRLAERPANLWFFVSNFFKA